MTIICVHQELRSYGRLQLLGLRFTGLLIFPFPTLLPVLGAASSACIPFKPPSCWGGIWHRPCFATGASPPTQPDSCLPKRQQDVLHSEPLSIQDALCFWLPKEITGPCLIQLPVGVGLSHRRFFCCYI